MVIMCLTCGVAFADTQDQYEEILDKYNKKYNVAIEYIPVKEYISLDKYEEIVKEVAKDERETQNYIEQIKLLKKDVANPKIIEKGVLKKKSKTVAAYNTDYLSASAYLGTATYYIASDNKISSVVSFSARYKNSIGNALGIMYEYACTSYTTNYYDAGKTLGITAKGNLTGRYSSGIGVSFGNVTTQYMFTDTY